MTVLGDRIYTVGVRMEIVGDGVVRHRIEIVDMGVRIEFVGVVSIRIDTVGVKIELG